MNKLTKLLSVFVIAGAVGAGVAGATGCQTPKHTHDYEYTVSTTDSAKHVKHCKKSGHEGADVEEEHTWESGKCKFCKVADPTAVASITVNADKTEANAGDTVTLSVEVLPTTATDKTVTWSITDGEDLADISATGVLTIKTTATNGGEVTVKATSNSDATKYGSKSITINKKTKFHELKEDTANNIIAEDFSSYEEGATIGAFSGTYGTRGISKNKDAGEIKVIGGKAVQTAGKEVQTVIDFGETKDVIEGYLEMDLVSAGNSWCMLRLIGTNSAGTLTNNEVIGLRHNNGNIDYRLESGADLTVADPVKNASANTLGVYFKYVKATQLITLEVAGKAYLTNYKADVVSLAGIVLASDSSGGKRVTVDNIAVNTYDLTKEDLKTAVDAYVAGATVDTPNEGEEALTLTGTGVTDAVAALKATIDEAETVEAAKEALDYEDINDAIFAQAKADAKAKLTDYRSNESFTHEDTNLPAMNKAKGDGADAIDAASDIDGVRAALKAAKAECDKVKNDTQDNAAKVDITLKLNNDSGEEVGEILQAVADEEISLADLIEQVTGDKYLKKIEIYTDAAHEHKVTTGYTPTVEEGQQSGSATLYVVITDIDNTGTFTYTVETGGTTLVYNTEDTEDVKAEDIYDLNETSSDIYDNGTFKMGGGHKIVLNVSVKAGQTITLNISGKSGSTTTVDGNKVAVATHITCAASGAGITATADKEFPDGSVISLDAITYTATQDGVVTITISRKDGTNRLSEVSVTVADDSGEEGGGGGGEEGEVAATKTINLTSGITLKTTAGADVEFVNSGTTEKPNMKTPVVADGTYDLHDANGKTIVSIGSGAAWKQDAYLQADGAGRQLNIDLSAYAGKKVNITVRAAGAKKQADLDKTENPQAPSNIKLGSGDEVLLPAYDASSGTPKDVVFENVDGGATVVIENTGNAVRYYSITITLVNEEA